MHTKLSRSKQ